jgi:Ca2+-binding EF-hand superfamily protein
VPPRGTGSRPQSAFKDRAADRPKSASDYVADDPDDVINDEDQEYSNGNYRSNQYGNNGNNYQRNEGDSNGNNSGNNSSQNNNYNYQNDYDNQYQGGADKGYSAQRGDEGYSSQPQRNLYGEYNNDNESQSLQDAASLNDNTLLTEPDEFNFNSDGNNNTNNQKYWRNVNNNENNDHNRNNRNDGGNFNHKSGYPDTRTSNGYRDSNVYNGYDNENLPERNENYDRDNTAGWSAGSAVHFEPADKPPDPIDHLNFLASQTLATVRDMVLSRQRGGKPLLEIYRHFDRDNKMYFDAKDLVKATSDLRIETTERVAALAVNQIALDGHDNVSYGEFQVYIIDPNHKALERIIQQQLADRFERQGRSYQTECRAIFWDNSNLQNKENDGFVTVQTFISCIKKLGIKLSSIDIDRIVTRFDVTGRGLTCSAERFLKMIESSDLWQQVQASMLHQEGAAEEAAVLRADSSHIVGSHSNSHFKEETINMAEYLGIKVISERYLLWIVTDALNVELPAQWAVLKDSKDRAFFYNRSTNQSRWDHPLDPHFKKLRDHHRQQHQLQHQQNQLRLVKDRGNYCQFVNYLSCFVSIFPKLFYLHNHIH